MGGPHRAPNQPYYKKQKSKLTFTDLWLYARHFSKSLIWIKSLKLHNNPMCTIVIHVLWMRTLAHREVKLPKFLHNWQVMEQEFKAWCLVVGSVLTMTRCLGICLCICMIMRAWVNSSMCACARVAGCLHVHGYECHCVWLPSGVHSSVTFSVRPSLTTPFKIIHSLILSQ